MRTSNKAYIEHTKQKARVFDAQINVLQVKIDGLQQKVAALREKKDGMLKMLADNFEKPEPAADPPIAASEPAPEEPRVESYRDKMTKFLNAKREQWEAEHPGESYVDHLVAESRAANV